MAYLNPSPGVSAKQIELHIIKSSGDTLGTFTNTLAVPALQNMTINNANDVFTWQQLDSTAKKQVPTTSTNSVTTNVVVDPTTFFGSNLTANSTNTVSELGLMGLSREKVQIDFAVRMENEGTATYIKGKGYVTGLAPAISADAPVWVTPMTITVTGEYSLTTTL